MNIVTRMLKRRASKKIEVLKACVAKNDEKRKINHDEYESLRHQYALLLEKIKFADENGDMVRRDQNLSDARSVKEKITFSDSKCKIYDAVYSVLDKFLALTQYLYDTDNYFMVIRSIPQHKLPRLINNTGKLKVLLDLVTELYNHLKDSAMVAFEDQEQMIRGINDIDASHTEQIKNIRAKYKTSSIDDQILMEALGKNREKKDEYDNSIGSNFNYN